MTKDKEVRLVTDIHNEIFLIFGHFRKSLEIKKHVHQGKVSIFDENIPALRY